MGESEKGGGIVANGRGRRIGSAARCALWVALCFTLTSAVWLSWLDGLMASPGQPAANWISVVAGYAAQAAGLGAAALWLGQRPSESCPRTFGLCVLLLVAIAVPSLLAGGAPWRVGCGLVMNLLCGAVSGFYLYESALRMEARRRGIAFGAGYAMATVAVGLMALAGQGWLLRGGHALIVCAPLGVVLIPITFRQGILEPGSEGDGETVSRETVGLACAVVALLSCIKSMGFSFPAPGLDPALSRLPYAAGLVVAGIINDHSRKDGMACAVAALVLPFILLGLEGEGVPGTIGWGIEYLLTGFFTVYRAVLFMDFAAQTRCWALAPLGLLMGRVGDALGSGLSLWLNGRAVALVALAALAFFVTLVAAFRLYHRLYAPQTQRQRSARELLEAFCQHHDLTGRERDIMLLMADRRTNREIAEALFISENTVKYHVRNVLQKTGCANRVELQERYKRALSETGTGDWKTEG